MSTPQGCVRPKLIRRPWAYILFIAIGVMTTFISARSYWSWIFLYYPADLPKRPFTHEVTRTPFEVVYLHNGWLSVSLVSRSDTSCVTQVVGNFSYEYRDFVLFRTLVRADYSSFDGRYVTLRRYSTKAIFWGVLSLIIGVCGYVKWWVIPMRRLRRGQCVNRGYDVRSNISGVCSECGGEIEISEGSKI